MPDHEHRTALRRRDFLAQSLAAGVAGTTVSASAAAAATPPERGVPAIAADGTYATIPLRRDTVTVGMMQTRVMPVDGDNPQPGLDSNLEHMLWAIDAAQYFGAKKDYLAFHEFPITGWAKWTRRQITRFALEVPGEQTERIAAKAREHDCYISFGTYARDADWPGHVISMSVIIDPRGQVISKQWKHRNIHGAFAEFELFTSSVYDVLDRYVEMYGWDAVIPVARTDIGNLCISPCQWEPELYRAMAVKGGEFLVRTSTGGQPFDMPVMCRVNGVYGALVNNSISPDNRYFLESAGGGGTAIYDPRGQTIAATGSQHEDVVVTQLPMADFRRRHRLPDYYQALYTHVLDRYQSRYPPGAFLDELPETLEDSTRLFRQWARW